MAVHVFGHNPVESAGGTVTEVRTTDSSGPNVAARVVRSSLRRYRRSSASPCWPASVGATKDSTLRR